MAQEETTMADLAARINQRNKPNGRLQRRARVQWTKARRYWIRKQIKSEMGSEEHGAATCECPTCEQHHFKTIQRVYIPSLIAPLQDERRALSKYLAMHSLLSRYGSSH
jgi:hypothetical protein